MSYLRFIVSVFFTAVVFFSVGCGMVDVKPPGEKDAALDLGDGLFLKKEAGRIRLIEDGVVLEPCGNKCKVFNGAVAVRSIESKPYRLGRKTTVWVVEVVYSPLKDQNALTFAALDEIHSLAQTDAHPNLILGHNITNECSSRSMREPTHNGCCSYTVTSVEGDSYNTKNRRDRDCRHD